MRAWRPTPSEFGGKATYLRGMRSIALSQVRVARNLHLRSALFFSSIATAERRQAPLTIEL